LQDAKETVSGGVAVFRDLTGQLFSKKKKKLNKFFFFCIFCNYQANHNNPIPMETIKSCPKYFVVQAILHGYMSLYKEKTIANSVSC